MFRKGLVESHAISGLVARAEHAKSFERDATPDPAGGLASSPLGAELFLDALALGNLRGVRPAIRMKRQEVYRTACPYSDDALWAAGNKRARKRIGCEPFDIVGSDRVFRRAIT